MSLETNQIKVVMLKDYQAVSEYAANIVISAVNKNPKLKLGLATGSSPQKMYEFLVKDHVQNGTSYANVSAYNLDEYVGLAKTDEQSYAYFMERNLFKFIDIKKENTHIPNGLATDLHKECENYEQVLKNIGGVDLQVMGIGVNGHIGFNEPGTSFDSKVHVIDLAESTIKENARFFSDISQVPKQAITMGISTILSAKKIILVASGKSKAAALHALLEGPMDEMLPANALRNHADVTIIADEDALNFRTTM